MGRRDVITGVVVGCIVVGYLAMALGLPDRGASRSGLPPSTYPFIVGALLLTAVTVQLSVAVVGWRRACSAGTSTSPTTSARGAGRAPTRWARAGAMFAGAWVYLWLLGVLGFVVASTLFLAFGARLVSAPVDREDWLRKRSAAAALGFGALTSVAIQLLFGEFLGVLLPPGLLPALVG